MSEALGAMALMCRWLVRDRDRRAVPLDAARHELDETREQLEVASLRRDAVFAERAAVDRELRRLVRRCDRLAQAQKRASAERDQAIRERERALAELRRVKAPRIDARSRGRDASDVSPAPRSLLSPAERSGVERAPEELLAGFVRLILGPRGAAIAALILAIALPLIILNTQ